jgi:hypothetical protein
MQSFWDDRSTLERHLGMAATGAAVAFLAIYSWQVLSDHQGPSEALGIILTVTWAMFAVDYVARHAQHRWS